MYHYCTYFDRNYLYKGLALYNSLRQHSPEFILHILCLDGATRGLLSEMKLPNVRLISQDEFERGDERLQQEKQSRSLVEYYWTCTPSLPLYLFAHNPEIDLVTYLDADLFFFSDPAPIFGELIGNSVLITEHRYSAELRYLEARGLFNVQFIAVRRDTNGLDCLNWWRERCLEWCYNRLEDGKFGDQKYLDDWPTLFTGVHAIQHPGAGVAPWNFSQYSVVERDGRLYIDSFPLIFYHFHQFRILTGAQFYLASSIYSRRKPFPDAIYQPYIQAIRRSLAQVRELDPAFAAGVESRLLIGVEATARKWLPTPIKNLAKRLL